MQRVPTAFTSSLVPAWIFPFWFGESKFYSSIEDARLAPIIESVRNSLATDKLRKENAIILNLPELDELSIDAGVRTAIKNALQSNVSIDILKHKINIPILLLHQCSITAQTTEITPRYRTEVAEYHKARANSYFRKHLAALKDIHKYSEIRFHLILFPVPKKQPIVDKFVADVGFYKG